MSGMHIFSGKPFDVGTVGDFSFCLAAGEKVGPEIKGTFRVVNGQKIHGKTGMVIEFTQIDTDSSLELYEVVKYNLCL